jgi:hypothetical protein
MEGELGTKLYRLMSNVDVFYDNSKVFDHFLLRSARQELAAHSLRLRQRNRIHTKVKSSMTSLAFILRRVFLP